MFCKYCCAPVSGDRVHCPSCGAKLDPVSGIDPEEWNGDTQAEKPVTFAFVPEQENPYSGMEWQSTTQTESTCSPQDWSEVQPPVKDTKKKIRLLTAGIVLTLLITAALVVWMVLPLGPGTDIALAARNTLEAGSLTMDFSFAAVEGDPVGGTVLLEIDPEQEELTLYARSAEGGRETVVAIYQGYLLLGLEGTFIGNKIQTDVFFDAYEELLEGKEIDWEEWINSMSEALDKDLQEIIDLEVFEDCMKEYGKSLNDADWLEEYAGFRKEKRRDVTHYSFRPRLYDFACASAVHLEPAFRSPTDYKEMMDELHSCKPAWDEMGLELGIGVEDDLLYDLDVTVLEDGGGYTLHLDFGQIGSTHIDTAALDGIVEDALILG